MGEITKTEYAELIDEIIDSQRVLKTNFINRMVKLQDEVEQLKQENTELKGMIREIKGGYNNLNHQYGLLIGFCERMNLNWRDYLKMKMKEDTSE